MTEYLPIQPHPKACTPTNIAFLASLATEVSPSVILQKIMAIPQVHQRLYLENYGMDSSFLIPFLSQLPCLGDLRLQSHPYTKETLISFPPPYEIGIQGWLPLPSFTLSRQQRVSLQKAQEVGSLVIENDKLIYPRGHAITVTQIDQKIVTYYDSYLGVLLPVSTKHFLDNAWYSLPDNCLTAYQRV